MSTHIGAGYGSKFHLMRYLGRYRNLLNSQIEKETGGHVIEWLDFMPDAKNGYATTCASTTYDSNFSLSGVTVDGLGRLREAAEEVTNSRQTIISHSLAYDYDRRFLACHILAK